AVFRGRLEAAGPSSRPVRKMLTANLKPVFVLVFSRSRYGNRSKNPQKRTGRPRASPAEEEARSRRRHQGRPRESLLREALGIEAPPEEGGRVQQHATGQVRPLAARFEPSAHFSQ